MKTSLKTLFTAVLVLVSYVAFSSEKANAWRDPDNRLQPLNQADFASMQQRLDRTIRSGRLTPKKAWHLQTKLSRIRYMQGVINASGSNWHEQKKLWHSMQSLSKSIASKEGHNWQLDTSPYGQQSQLP